MYATAEIKRSVAGVVAEHRMGLDCDGPNLRGEIRAVDGVRSLRKEGKRGAKVVCGNDSLGVGW